MHRSPINLPGRQRGAVLYVALIFLILLSLLGIVGMQVAALQERMASNYRATNQAFQRAEGLARRVELQINTDGRFIPRPGERDEQRFCDDSDPVRGSAWAGMRAADDDPDTAVVAAQLDGCVGEGPLAMGVRPTNEKGNATYQISVFTTDLPTDATSDSAVETVFKP
jgi:type IV pilus assembly protein PilX